MNAALVQELRQYTNYSSNLSSARSNEVLTCIDSSTSSLRLSGSTEARSPRFLNAIATALRTDASLSSSVATNEDNIRGSRLPSMHIRERSSAARCRANGDMSESDSIKLNRWASFGTGGPASTSEGGSRPRPALSLGKMRGEVESSLAGCVSFQCRVASRNLCRDFFRLSRLKPEERAAIAHVQ